MKPRSGLSVGRDAFCFFSSSAIAAESVRGLRIVSLELSASARESMQLFTEAPVRVAQPDLKSLDGPPAAVERHSGELALVPTHAVSSTITGRRETEYMSAAKEETATVRSRTAINSSPMMKARRAVVPCAESACKLTLVFHPVVDPGVAEGHKRTGWCGGPRDFARVVVILLRTVRF